MSGNNNNNNTSAAPAANNNRRGPGFHPSNRRNKTRWQRIREIENTVQHNEINKLGGIAKNLVHSRALGWSKMYEELNFAAEHHRQLNEAQREINRPVPYNESNDNMNIDQLLARERNELLAQNEYLCKVIKNVCSGMREELECKAQCGKVIGNQAAAAAEPEEYFTSKNMVVPSCGHIICRPCFNSWSQTKGTTAPPCPHCRAPMFGVPQVESDNSDSDDAAVLASL